MTRRCFSGGRACAGQYRIETPEGLSVAEGISISILYGQERGRLEQEFLPREPVAAALRTWHGGTPG